MLDWAIVGCGVISDLRIAPALKGSQINRLAAVVSRDAEKAATFARKHGAGKSFGSFEEMLQDQSINVVYLGTPNALHASQTVAACAAGKHVFCEKPMALTVADCESMVRAARDNGVKLGVCFNNRYNPAHQEIKRRLDAGAIGEVRFASVQAGVKGRRIEWRLDRALAGGGVLMDMGVHTIDLLRYLLGREVTQVSAMLDTTTFGWPLDEVVSAVLEFEGGIHAFIGVSQKVPYARNGVEVCGSNGAMVAVGRPVALLRDPITLSSNLQILRDGEAGRKEFASEDQYSAALDAFGNAITGETEPEISGVDGLRTQEVAVAIQESAKTGKTIRLRRSQEP